MYFHEKKSKSGKVLQLLQSYRNAEGHPRHRVVTSLGNAKIEKNLLEQIALGVERKLCGQLEFDLIKYSKESRKWIEKIVRLIERKGSDDTIQINQVAKDEPEQGKSELVDGVNLNKIEHTHSSSLGPALLGLQAWKELKLDYKLQKLGFNESQRKTAAATVISRLIEPMSEHAMLENLESSSLPDLLGYDLTRGVKDRFYRVSDKLMSNKIEIEAHIRKCQQEHFELDRTILLYDLTNSHFEGACLSNPKAKRGKNKQKRNDCNQIVVGMIFDENGFELAHETFVGNLNDSKSLPEMVKRMEEITVREPLLEAATKSLVIVDAGIATKNNLDELRRAGFSYLVNDSRRGRKKYQSEFKEKGFQLVEGREGKSQVEVKRIEEELNEPKKSEDNKSPKKPKAIKETQNNKSKEEPKTTKETYDSKSKEGPKIIKQTQENKFNEEQKIITDNQDSKLKEVAMLTEETHDSELKEEAKLTEVTQASKPKKESVVLCRSGARKDKENAIITQAENRFLEQLERLKKRLESGRLIDPDKIQRAIGRIISKNPRVSHYYSVQHKIIESKATPPETKYSLEYKRDEDKYHLNEELLGCYVLRTDIMDFTASELWSLYMTLSYAEEGFEILKSDLGLRPNFHQIENRVDGHVFITVLSYQLLRFILHTLKLAGDNRCWLTIKRILESHCYSTIIVPSKNGIVHRLRKAGQPESAQNEIYKHFNIPKMNKLPHTKVKIVVEP